MEFKSQEEAEAKIAELRQDITEYRRAIQLMKKSSSSILAVEAMVAEPCIRQMMGRIYIHHREILRSIAGEHPEDWMEAGLKCRDPKDILPVCMHTFLKDWTPAAKMPGQAEVSK